MQKLIETIEKIKSDIQTNLKGQCRVLPHNSNWASVLAKPCIREQVYYRLDWEKQSLPNEYLQGIFNTGLLVEDMTINTLNRIGLSASPKWQLLKIPDKINDKALAEAQIGSVTDVFLIVYDENNKPVNLGPVEIKSIDPNKFKTINKIEDFQKHHWMRTYTGQLSVYMFGSNYQQGAFLLVNKTNWWDYKIFPYQLDFDFMQKLLNTAKLVNSFVQTKQYPDRIDDKNECKYCPFKTFCLPDECSDQIQLVDNEDFLALLEQRDALQEASKEYKELDDEIKERLTDNKDGTYLIGGKYQIKLSTYDRSSYDIPDDIKGKYAKKVPCRKTNITKIKE
jgi:CRISPR/Cas system-associated exonuclease Cas4 (RecB family)